MKMFFIIYKVRHAIKKTEKNTKTIDFNIRLLVNITDEKKY